MKTKLTPEQCRQYRRKWGIPDWRDHKAYPSSLPNSLWRWEFIRRSKDYRDDWEQCYPKTVNWLKKGEQKRELTDAWLWLNARGNNPKSSTFRALMPSSVEKYGLDGLPNPAISVPENLSFVKPVEPGSLSTGLITYGNGRSQYIIPREHVALCIDLAQPIKPQLEIYDFLFRRLAEGGEVKIKSETKEYTIIFSKYLRVYDGRCEGCTLEEVGMELKLAKDYNAAAARAAESYRAAKKIQKRYIRITK